MGGIPKSCRLAVQAARAEVEAAALLCLQRIFVLAFVDVVSLQRVSSCSFITDATDAVFLPSHGSGLAIHENTTTVHCAVTCIGKMPHTVIKYIDQSNRLYDIPQPRTG